MTDGGAVRGPSAAVLALITVRFLLELALWSSFTIASVRLIDGPLGWVTGLLLTAVVITLWAVLLSPRRPVRLPVAVRVAIELALFVVAASLLAAAGLAAAGAGLLALELLDLGLLHGPDKHAL
ncbi:MAG TPA: YrdB family protein [Dermatophilaceae bacterium]|nr:YrdB family protein [Dermatophilaceae bacterium]